MEKLCPACGTALNGRREKIFCNDACRQRFKRREKKKSPRPATHVPAVDNSVTARLFADGFYLPDLYSEIERIRKTTPGLVASVEAQLVHEMTKDAVWPSGLIGRIAITLALLKNASLLAMPVKWRHGHERRHRPGDPRKPTGLMVRRGMVRL